MSHRSTSHYSHRIAAAPSKVFPLLCPVREYEWIDVWQGKLVYSVSGFAEEDCVFTTNSFASIGPETWICSRYEPPARIDYTRVSAHTAIRLALSLKAEGEGTLLSAAYIATATTETGEAFLEELGPEPATAIYRPCFLMLDHFLRTGTMLPSGEAKAHATR
jgi:hypothetical protein